MEKQVKVAGRDVVLGGSAPRFAPSDLWLIIWMGDWRRGCQSRDKS